MPIALAAMCALLWGTADFCGGTASRRSPSTVVLLWSSALALPVVVVLWAVVDRAPFTTSTVLWGAVAGGAGALGILSLYRGLATGVMGVVAPISSTSVIVPVVYGYATGADLPVLCGLGIVVAIVGVVLAGGPHIRDFRGSAAPLLFALAASLGIGVSLVAVAEGSRDAAFPTLVSMRIAYLIVLVPIVLLSRGARTVDRSSVPLVAAAGLGDVLAVTLYGIATRGGSLPVVAALASMYPVTTLVLARQLHHERLEREQWIGVLTALVGIVLVVTTQ